MNNKPVQDLKPGDIVGEDLYHHDTLLVKKGTELNPHMIRRLKVFQIKQVPVQIMNDNTEAPNSIENKIKHTPAKSRNTVAVTFYTVAKHLLQEERYGLALNKEEEFRFVSEQFEQLIDDPFICKQLKAMKDWEAYTFYHSIDVFTLGILFGQYLGFANIDFYGKACLLHDIGKLKIPVHLLHKKGTLTKAEFNLIKTHTTIGKEMLESNTTTFDTGYLAKQHHERLDGSGYPHGLKGDRLDEYVRALMIVDTFSAMTLYRPHQQARSSLKALKSMAREQHKFDRSYLQKFMDMLHIYVPHSIVRLSDQRKAEVLTADEHQPFLPKLVDLKTYESLQIPINFSVSISECLSISTPSTLSISETVRD